MKTLIITTSYCHFDPDEAERHGGTTCLHAEVPAFAETFRAGRLGVTARRRGNLDFTGQ